MGHQTIIYVFTASGPPMGFVFLRVNKQIISTVGYISISYLQKKAQKVFAYLQPKLELELLCSTSMTHHIHDPELLKYTAALFRKMMSRLGEIRLCWCLRIQSTSSSVGYTFYLLLYHCTADAPAWAQKCQRVTWGKLFKRCKYLKHIWVRVRDYNGSNPSNAKYDAPLED